MAYIEFDKINKRLKRPILLLETPNGNVLGKIKYSDFAFNLSGSQLSEISFSIHKFEDGKLNNLWDKCTGIKIAEWQDLGCFEASFSISDEDEIICIFPEGTYHKDDILLPFKKGAVDFAIKSHKKIIPFAIIGEYKFRSNPKLVIGKPIDVSKMDIITANNHLENVIRQMIVNNLQKN